jgi:hypothetical protein
MDHHTTLHEVGEGSVQAVCSCGWRSPVFGAGKAAGTMDPQQRAAPRSGTALTVPILEGWLVDHLVAITVSDEFVDRRWMAEHRSGRCPVPGGVRRPMSQRQ